MNYNFSKKIDRSKNNAVKIEEVNRKDNESDLLPMWVADMDFEAAPEILEAMQQKLDQKIFGYTNRPESYYKSVVTWTKKIHNIDLNAENLEHSPGVIPSISILIRLFTKIEDKVMIQAPVYPPFFNVVEKNNRKLVVNNLIEENGIYKIDFDDFEKKAKDEKTKFFILCNPHNPVGRVWTKEELKKMGEICLRNNVRIISDDIWRDLIHKGSTYIPISSISKEIEDITITCFSAAKTFNLAGLQGSFVYFPRKDEQKIFKQELGVLDILRNTPFNLVAIETAFTKGEKWYRELLVYLEGNINFMEEYMKKNIPNITFTRPEASYLIWLDFRKLNITKEELERLIRDEAKLVLNKGYTFSKDCELFQRINIACSRDTLEAALERLKKVFG